MKLIVYLFSLCLMTGVGGLFILKQPDGTPWLVMNDFLPDMTRFKQTIHNVASASVTSTLPSEKSTAVQLYRWQDRDGNWQYSDIASAAYQAELVTVSTDVNRDLVPVLTTVFREITPHTQKWKAMMIHESGSDKSAMKGMPSQISELLNNAKGIQQLADERAKMLKSLK